MGCMVKLLYGCMAVWLNCKASVFLSIPNKHYQTINLEGVAKRFRDFFFMPSPWQYSVEFLLLHVHFL